MKTLTIISISILSTTAVSAQTATTQSKKPSSTVECENLHPEKVLNKGAMSPDFYTYDHTASKEQCIAKVPETAAAKDTVKRDYILMKNGTAIKVSKEGAQNLMTKNVTLSNGTTVTAKGEVIKKDGTTKVLKEGEYIDMSGKMVSDK